MFLLFELITQIKTICTSFTKVKSQKDEAIFVFYHSTVSAAKLDFRGFFMCEIITKNVLSEAKIISLRKTV